MSRVPLGFLFAPGMGVAVSTLFVHIGFNFQWALNPPWSYYMPGGVLVAYTSALLFGVPLYFLMNRLTGLEWWQATIGGFLCGVPAWIALPYPNGDESLNRTLYYAMSAALSGFFFWLIVRRPVRFDPAPGTDTRREPSHRSDLHLPMTLTRRSVASAPLLVLGLIIAYVTIVFLLDPWPRPCTEYGWIIGSAGAASFAFYFLAGFVLIVARAYLAMGIATLWAWQLYVLLPVAKFVERWTDPIGFGFLLVLTGVVALGIVTSIMMYLRYRVVDGLGQDAQQAVLRGFVAGTTVLVVLLVAGIYVVAPEMREFYLKHYGNLPGPAVALAHGYHYAGLIALPFVVAWVYAGSRSWHDAGQLRAGLDGALALLIIANLLLSALAFTTYTPLLKGLRCV